MAAISDEPRLDFDLAMNLARQSLYRFAALTLLDPRAESWQRLREAHASNVLDGAAALVRENPEARAESLAFGEEPLAALDPARVLAMLPDSQARLNEQYEQTFGLLVSSNCPPYETEYIHSKFTFQRSQALGDVSGFYAAFGLQPSAEHPERHDHIVLELEFMAFLLGLEREAAQGDIACHEERLEVCRSAQRKFLAEHLAWWTPALARLMARQDSHGFYAAAGKFLAALVAAERALLDVSPPEGKATPATIERPEECEGCALAQ